MLESLVRWSLNNRLLVILATLLLIGAGSLALIRLPIDAFPDTTPIQVQINTVAPALSPEEIEQQLTLPIEWSLGGLPGLKNVRSISKFGLSQVVATFTDDTDITDARQFIAERISTVELPEGIESPELGPIATGLGEVFHYLVSSDNPKRDIESLRTVHDWIIKPELRQVPGVAEVNSWGGKEKQFHVIASPQRLLRYDLTIEDLAEALEHNNRNVGGGVITKNGTAKLVRGVGRVGTIADIGSIVIASHDGQPVYVRDVAENIEIGYEIRRGAVTAQGKGEAVLGLAFTLMGENPAIVTQALKERLASVKRSLPDDIQVEVLYDRTELTDQVINTVSHNLIAGAALVVLVLFVLLGNLRAGLLVAVMIPLAMLFALLGMHWFAIAASLLSLGAIDFGIIVDGSVVMTEANLRNLARRRQELGRDLTAGERFSAIVDSAREVARPIAFGMGIILIVFLPILTLEGTEGKMFRPMAATFILALAGALVLALTLSPVLGYWLLPKQPRHGDGFVGGLLIGFYQKCLALAVRFRWVVLSFVFILLCGASILSLRIGGEFIPRLKEGSLVLNTIRLAGTAIDTSAEYNSRIEGLLLQSYPDEIRSVWSRIGTAEVATDPMGTELTDIFITLHPREQWKLASTQEELASKIQDTVADLPGLNMTITQPIEMRLNEMESGIRSDLGVKIYGDDFDTLVEVADNVQRVLIDIQGQSDISVDQLTGQPVLDVRVNRDALARYGVTADAALQVVESIGGIRVGRVYEGQRNFPLVLRLPDQFRSEENELGNMLVPGANGALIPLRQLVDIVQVEGVSTINREWGRRLIRVQCNVNDRDVASFVEEAKMRIAEQVTLPEGYVVSWGGQFENLERAQTRLAIVVPVALLLVLTLLYLSLRSVRDVTLIATGIPFAFVGGIAALAIRDIPFSVSAAVGFIALAGIAVLNGQILVGAIRRNCEDGLQLADAITRAGGERLRPVLATAITDAVGFIPMAISVGVGAEVQQPLATVVIGGVISSTILTLFVLPILYRMFGSQRGDEQSPQAAQ